MNKNIAIIDYHLGNLFSVKQACETVGLDATITSAVQDLENASALILPGVGAFNEAMKNLKDLHLDDAIRNAVEAGKPLFGVCLGLQLLFTESEEFGSSPGLNLLPGVIRKFPTFIDQQRIKIPQIGWNTIYKAEMAWELGPLKDLSENEFMYFVHSYYASPTDKLIIYTKTNYAGLEYCSGILKDNIFATQFHPEKSTEKGLSIYKNWALLNNLL